MLKKVLFIFLVSMVPIVELRGAIPLGISLDLNIWLVLAVSIAGNLLPVPFIMLFIKKIFGWMKKKGGWMADVVAKMDEKAAKGAEKVYKYEMLGLFILVAVPLPGTGAWTGALVAAMIEMKMRNAVPVIALGVVAAGLAMLFISYGSLIIF